MRFNWRSRIMATAFAALSFLPLTGCSSQQQGQEEVVQGQQGEESQGQQGEELSGQQGEEGSQNVAEGEQQQAVQGENGENGENIASNQGDNSAPASEEQLQEVMNEMTSNGGENIASEPTMPNSGQEEAPAAIQEVAPETNPVAVTETPAATPVASVQPSQTPGLPEANSKMPYVVQAGDTLGKIAAKIYGDQKRWRDLSDLTGLSNPNSIYPGDVVYYTLDEAAAQFAAKEASMVRGMEVVQQGDTLAAISKRVYGSSKHWRYIWRQNDNIDNPDKLSAGMNVYYVTKDSMQTVFNLDSKLESSNVAVVVAKTSTKTATKYSKHSKHLVSNLR